MPVENATHIADLNTSNPVGSTDKVQTLDDHIRLIKSVLKTDLNLSGPVTATHTELNILDGATLSTAELNVLDGITATTAELNILDGVTLTASQINDAARKTAANTFTSKNTFTQAASGANGLEFSSALPGYWLVETDASADNQDWRVSVDTGVFRIGLSNGARNSVANVFQIARNGNTATSIQLDATTFDFNGNLDVDSTTHDINGTTSVTLTSGTAVVTLTNSDDQVDLTGAIVDINGTTTTIDGTTVTLTGGSAVITLSGAEADITATTLDFNGNADISGTLAVGGALTVSSGGAAITGNSSVTGTLGVTSNATVGGTLGVTGATTLTGAVTAATIASSTSTTLAAGQLHFITGNATLPNLAAGQWVEVINDSASPITISKNGSDTTYWSLTGATVSTSFTLAARGRLSAVCSPGGSAVYVAGSGITGAT